MPELTSYIHIEDYEYYSDHDMDEIYSASDDSEIEYFIDRAANNGVVCTIEQFVECTDRDEIIDYLGLPESFRTRAQRIEDNNRAREESRRLRNAGIEDNDEGSRLEHAIDVIRKASPEEIEGLADEDYEVLFASGPRKPSNALLDEIKLMCNVAEISDPIFKEIKTLINSL